jgi:hypothetical protein
MKTRVSILVIIGLLLATSLTHSYLAKPKVNGNFTPEDVRQILQETSRHRWGVLRQCLLTRNFTLFFGLCVADPTRGQICKTGYCPHYAEEFEASMVSESPSRAYVISGSYEYGLERTTNGWQMFSLGHNP